MINKIKRFFIRMWLLNRNQLLGQAFKILEKELAKRREVLLAVPKDRRNELIENDYILNWSMKIYLNMDKCLEGIKRA